MSLVLASIVLLAAVAADPAPAETAEERLAALGWLEGTWRGPHGKGTWEARYSGPDGGLILGTDKQVADGKLVLFEFEEFRVEDGEVVLRPWPNGKRSPAAFTLTEHDPGARRAVFANPEHDFPQRIVFHRVAADELRVRVEAEREGRTVGFELRLARQP